MGWSRYSTAEHEYTSRCIMLLPASFTNYGLSILSETLISQTRLREHELTIWILSHKLGGWGVGTAYACSLLLSSAFEQPAQERRKLNSQPTKFQNSRSGARITCAVLAPSQPCLAYSQTLCQTGSFPWPVNSDHRTTQAC